MCLLAVTWEYAGTQFPPQDPGNGGVVGEMGTTSFAAGRERGCRFDSERMSRNNCTDGRELESYFKGFPQVYRFGKRGGSTFFHSYQIWVRSRIGSWSRWTSLASNLNFSRSKLEKRRCPTSHLCVLTKLEGRVFMTWGDSLFSTTCDLDLYGTSLLLDRLFQILSPDQVNHI